MNGCFDVYKASQTGEIDVDSVKAWLIIVIVVVIDIIIVIIYLLSMLAWMAGLLRCLFFDISSVVGCHFSCQSLYRVYTGHLFFMELARVRSSYNSCGFTRWITTLQKYVGLEIEAEIWSDCSPINRSLLKLSVVLAFNLKLLFVEHIYDLLLLYLGSVILPIINACTGYISLLLLVS